jgi:hypothetical protein
MKIFAGSYFDIILFLNGKKFPHQKKQQIFMDWCGICWLGRASCTECESTFLMQTSGIFEKIKKADTFFPIFKPTFKWRLLVHFIYRWIICKRGHFKKI